MTKIFNTDTNEVVELQVVSDGQDFLAEVIGNSDQQGHWLTERDDADFEMDEADCAWWERWAEREQAILDKANEMGEPAIEKLCELAGEYGHDFEELQDKEEEYLGI